MQKGTDLIQRFYLSQGYLEARVGQPTVEYNQDRTRATLTVPIIEGRAYKFDGVRLEGNLVFPEKEVRGLIADQIPLPYTRPRVDAMQRKLEDYYKHKGYFTAVVTANSDPTKAGSDYRVPTSYVINPGPLYHFDGVRIVGTDRLKPEYLRNRFRSLSGKVYDPKALDDVYQLMIRTGLFAQLKVDPVPQARRPRCAWTSASRKPRRASSVSRLATVLSRVRSWALKSATATFEAPGGRSVSRWIIPRARSAASCSISIPICSRAITSCASASMR